MKRIRIVAAAALGAAAVVLAGASDPSRVAEPALEDPRPGLLVLELQGPATAAVESTQQYTLIARYANGTAKDVTERAEWQVDSAAARVNNGILTVSPEPGVRTVTVSAWFTDGLSYKAARTVVLEIPVEASGEGVSPAETLPEPEIPAVGPSSCAPSPAVRSRTG